MNVFGERQHPENLFLCVLKIFTTEKVFIHSDKSKKIAGSRHYIHAEDVADGTFFDENLNKLKNTQTLEELNVQSLT